LPLAPGAGKEKGRSPASGRPFHFLPECAPMTEGTGPAE
jgi:hypothetical protein